MKLQYKFSKQHLDMGALECKSFLDQAKNGTFSSKIVSFLYLKFRNCCRCAARFGKGV